MTERDVVARAWWNERYVSDDRCSGGGVRIDNFGADGDLLQGRYRERAEPAREPRVLRAVLLSVEGSGTRGVLAGVVRIAAGGNHAEIVCLAHRGRSILCATPARHEQRQHWKMQFGTSSSAFPAFARRHYRRRCNAGGSTRAPRPSGISAIPLSPTSAVRPATVPLRIRQEHIGKSRGESCNSALVHLAQGSSLRQWRARVHEAVRGKVFNRFARELARRTISEGRRQ